jgi:hypothetical protein
MPSYSLDEAEKLVPEPHRQIMFFGQSIQEMRDCLKENEISGFKLKLWLKLEDIKK